MSTLEKHSAPAKPFDLMAVDANGNMTRISIGDLINAIALTVTELDNGPEVPGGDFKAVTVNGAGRVCVWGLDEIGNELMGMFNPNT